MSELSIGLPNQALKPMVSAYVPVPALMTPFEQDGYVAVLGAGVRTDVPLTPNGAALVTVPANQKITLDSITVKVGVVDTLVRLYRGAAIIAVFQAAVKDVTYQLFTDGIGKEYNEGETFKITAESAAGGGNVWVSLSGRSEMMRNQLFSPVIA
jgi:hypothetical protein